MAETFTDRQKAFMAYPRYAVLTTLLTDGSPQATVIWYIRDGEEIVFTSEADAFKVKNMRRDPRVSLVITDGGRYVSIRGKVEIDDNDELAAEWLLRIAKRYYGAEEGQNQFNEFHQKPYALMRLKPDRILSVSV